MGDSRMILGDCNKIPLEDDAVDLVFCSPPYEAARTYGIDFKLKGDAWVDWAVPRFLEHLRVSKGLVAWVVQGQTRRFKWSATPALLMAKLHGLGVNLRNPPIYYRSGIPGSGGPDWLRSDYEWIVCASQPGRLPWSDNTACGHPTKYDEGGACTNRNTNGKRLGFAPRNERELVGTHRAERQAGRKYAKPKSGLANPGNAIEIIDEGLVVKAKVGGRHMGHQLAHENEAPFPLKLAEFFVKSFCPPDGTVLDPFCGSGTTAHAAEINGRKWIAMDIRQSQLDLTAKRLREVAA